jgi:hypothetical protein
MFRVLGVAWLSFGATGKRPWRVPCPNAPRPFFFILEVRCRYRACDASNATGVAALRIGLAIGATVTGTTYPRRATSNKGVLMIAPSRTRSH